MEEQTQDSVNLEIPSRWRRFSAYLLDLIINITIIFVCSIAWELGFILILIWFIVNLVIIFWKKTTLWNNIIWIKAMNENNSPINVKQVLFRYLIFSPVLLNIIICVWFSISLLFWLVPTACSPSYPSDFCQMQHTVSKITNIVCIILLVPCLINIFEIFFKCPTFIDRRLWIKRFYKKSK